MKRGRFEFIYQKIITEAINTGLIKYEFSEETISRLMQQPLLQVKKDLDAILFKAVTYESDQLNIVFSDYEKQLSQNQKYINDFMHNNKAILEIMEKVCKNKINYIFEVLVNVRKDIEELRKMLPIENFDDLLCLNVNSGDYHENQKSVTKLIFKEGVCYYKPRNIEVEVKIMKFIIFMFQQIGFYYNEPYKYIIKTNYGYQSEIKQGDVIEEGEVIDYMRNAGVMLAAAYFLNITDLHHENVIADKKFPVFVDCETSFQNNEYTWVLETGLLPGYTIFDGSVAGYCRSGSQKTIMNNYKLVEIDSKNKFEESGPIVFNAMKNHLLFKGAPVDYKNYTDVIIRGFELGFKYFFEYYEEVKNFFEEIEGKPIRVLLDQTYVFARYINLLTYPQILNNEFKKKDFLAKIEKKYPDNKEVVSSLLNFEIPRTLTSLEVNIRHFEANEYDDNLKLQKELILASFKFESSQRIFNLEEMYSKDNVSIKEKINNIYNLLENRKINIKIKNRNYVSWIEYFEVGSVEKKLLIAGDTLFNGRAGILDTYINMYEKGSVNMDVNIIKKLAYEIFESTVLDEDVKFRHGFYEGTIGVLFILKKADKLFDLGMSNSIINFIKQNIQLNKNILDFSLNEIDLFKGIGGTLFGINKLIIIEEDNNIKKLKTLQNYLRNLIVRMINYYDIPDSTFTGFAHGTSGIIVSILRSKSEKLNNDEIECLNKLLNYERRCLNKNRGVIGRSFDDKNIGPGWCHGVGGILLSRIELLKRQLEPEIVKIEMINMVQYLMKHNFSKNISICHGDLGNMYILKESIQYMDLNSIPEIFENIKTIENRIMFLNNYEHMLSSGLFVGISGVAQYFMNSIDFL